MVVKESRWLSACAGSVLVWVLVLAPDLPGQEAATSSSEAVYQEATAAETADEMTRVLDRLESLRRSAATDDSREYLTKLQAWLLHRRGEAYVQQAGEAAAGGNAQAGRQLDRQAMLDFDAAIQLDPQRWKSYHHRGVCYALAGKFREALHDFSRTIELQPDYESAWFNRGEVHYELGEFAKAVLDYDQAIHLQAHDAGFYASRGHAHFQLRRFEQALTDYEKAVSLDPDNAERYADRGNAYRSLRQWDKAAQDFRQAITLDSSFGRAFQSAAWLMATCPDEEYRNATLAIEAAKKSMKLDGDRDYIYLDTLAAAYANNGEYQRAEETVRRALQLAPPENAASLKSRLELYQAGKPYRQTTGGTDRTAARPKRPVRRS